MKRKLASFLIWFYKKIIGYPPCIVYDRPYKYTLKSDWFAKECPFCSLKENKIVKEYKSFYLIKNKYPYPYTADHLLAIPKRHLVKWQDLSLEELNELRDIIANYLDKWYMMLGRHFWPHPKASVEHLHIHFIKEIFI